jgi:hypothetical protein
MIDRIRTGPTDAACTGARQRGASRFRIGASAVAFLSGIALGATANGQVWWAPLGTPPGMDSCGAYGATRDAAVVFGQCSSGPQIQPAFR